MENLWQKESSAEGAMYRNLFKDVDFDYPDNTLSVFFDSLDEVCKFTLRKNNTVSKDLRNEGNDFYVKSEFKQAIELYNYSLCVAEINTENVAKAYGNRSACYFHLQMYQECIKDIELALEEKCSEKLRDTLENRREASLKILKENERKENKRKRPQPEFFLGTHHNFPCVAECLQFQKNDQYGRHFVASEDISVNMQVLIEKSFVCFTKPDNYLCRDGKNHEISRCHSCLKLNHNTIPCLKCPLVVFCNETCRDGDRIHNVDCGSTYYLEDDMLNKIVIQSIIAALQLFPNVHEMIEFVQNTMKDEKFKIPENVDDELSQYRLFLTLWTPPKMDNFLKDTFRLFKTIFRIQKVALFFDTLEKQRFLMHLIGQHTLIINYNSIDGHVGVCTSLFNHSCVPNVQAVHVDNRTVCITIRPVKKGEQLCISYLTWKDENRLSVKELSKKYFFHCRCLKCKIEILPNLPGVEQDDEYNEIANQADRYQDKLNECLYRRRQIEKCVRVLNKYKHMPYSTEMLHVSKALGLYYYLLYNSEEALWY